MCLSPRGVPDVAGVIPEPRMVPVPGEVVGKLGGEVEPHDLLPVVEEAVHKVTSNEAPGPGDDDHGGRAETYLPGDR